MDLLKIRREFHTYPETSGNEIKTARALVKFLESTHPDTLHTDLGGNGVAAVYSGPNPGPRVVFRCDMDALPIHEDLNVAHKSKNSGASHKCGHDGHMTIMLGVALALKKNRSAHGEILLLFQPAEETGEGAQLVVQDSRYQDFEPDWVFAMHNLPGYPLGQLVVREGCFASASRGLIIRLEGKTSHAAEPEKGNSPALALAELMNRFTFLPQNSDLTFREKVTATVIHCQMGEIAFGTTPGQAVIMVTLRTHDNSNIEQLAQYSENLAINCAKSFQLKCEIEWTEQFPACINNSAANQFLAEIASENNLPIQHKADPFGWSEDFGHFLTHTPGAIFGMGAGLDCASLHHPAYDYPDELTPLAVRVWTQLAYKITG